MSVITHHNYQYGSSYPEAVGDRLYAQDIFRDFRYLQDYVGRTIKDILGDETTMLIRRDGKVEQGSGDNLDIPKCVGYAKYEVEVSDDYSVGIPPAFTAKDLEYRRIETEEKEDFDISDTATLDGSTTNYLKIAYKEKNGQSRDRAKASGSYVFEVEDDYEITCDDSEPTDYEVLVAEIVGDEGDSFTITNRRPYNSSMPNVPIGTIMMFDANADGGGGDPDGASEGWKDNETMKGWYACVSGNSEHGCPDLVDKFVMGKSDDGNDGSTGGSNTHTISSDELPTHTHDISHDHSVNQSSAGGHNHGGDLRYEKGIELDDAAPHGVHDSFSGSFYDIADGDFDVRVTEWITFNTSSVSDHNHSVSVDDHSGSSGDGGFDNNSIDNRPAYYSVVYIRKCA